MPASMILVFMLSREARALSIGCLDTPFTSSLGVLWLKYMHPELCGVAEEIFLPNPSHLRRVTLTQSGIYSPPGKFLPLCDVTPSRGDCHCSYSLFSILHSLFSILYSLFSILYSLLSILY